MMVEDAPPPELNRDCMVCERKTVIVGGDSRLMKDATIKNYIMAIHEAGGEKEFVRTSDVAKALGYRPSSVTETFQKMAQEGVIVYISYRGVKLTEKGKRIVNKTIARQNTLRSLLLYIGAPPDLAKIESTNLEQVISDRCIECIRKFLKTQEKNDE